MNRYVGPDALREVLQAFSSETVVLEIQTILPVRAIGKTVKASHKYQQITSSIKEIGIVEPPVVCRDKQRPETYLLLDGHLRIEVLKELGRTQVECILSHDDEAFTYNKRISRLSPIQEQRMIAKAIERNVPKEKVARALNINTRSLLRKATLVDGICEEVVALLKDKICPLATFDVLRKMIPIRQIEATELLINANNYSVGYVSAILAGTPQTQLVDTAAPKKMKGMTAEALSRMESELARLQQAMTSIQDTYGQDHLHLTVARGYLAKLVGNPRIAKYLEKHRPEFLSEFKNIVEMTSTIGAD
ncbi:ParB N-terminal domain-containing protein [Bradyrhizobium septentrionale]|uniref:ParB N-terminal domain-containing protein n=1 Tax=Bradyrhizobium septentrionale TaxID=1404411 RepID=A0A973ZY34_9BRAD|nr:plasmid partitioning protein RepB C-terminal domain-containing protein [Bradyrhizobium septentrionale]UGY19005.1 ParB N-terminal domain-containing protein [Bradyrhizobium septentrionale]UGY27734.1 ParB N-terminal domain-containing protein [Bradyrhizobium septentrionale]